MENESDFEDSIGGYMGQGQGQERDRETWTKILVKGCGVKPEDIHEATMVLLVWEGRGSAGLIAMATLDHSSYEAPSHRVFTLVGSCSHRCRDDGGLCEPRSGGEL